MKTLFFSINSSKVFTIFFLIFFTSCGSQQSIDSSWSFTTSPMVAELLEMIDSRFSEGIEFSNCAEEVYEICSDDSICIETGIDQCMMDSAAFTGDGSAIVCSEFLWDEARNSCLFSETLTQAIQAQDVWICETLSWESFNRCNREIVIILASQSGDINMCETLTERGEQVQCRNRVVTNLAIQEINVSLCDEVEMYLWDFGALWEELSEISGQDNFEKQMCREQVEMMQESLQDTE